MAINKIREQVIMSAFALLKCIVIAFAVVVICIVLQLKYHHYSLDIKKSPVKSDFFVSFKV